MDVISTATLNLTINSTNSGVEVASACESYTWIDGTPTYQTPLAQPLRLCNTEGCDSVVTLDLTIRNTSSSIDTVTYCGVYTWADSVQYSTDTFGPTVTYTNSVGCDSIVTLFLTIEPLNTVISVTHKPLHFPLSRITAPISGLTVTTTMRQSWRNQPIVFTC